MPYSTFHRHIRNRPDRRLTPQPPVGGGVETAIRTDPAVLTAIGRWIKSWARNTADWVHSASERLRGPARDDRIFDELADVVRSAREPAEIEGALARLACQVAGARQAELILEPAIKAASGAAGHRLVTCWPEAAALDSASASAGTAPPSPSGGNGTRPPLNLAVGPVERSRLILRLVPASGQRWSPRVIRQLTTLCTLAAAARAALAAARPTTNRARPSHSQSPVRTDTLRDGRFLAGFLSHALAQAKRNEDSLSLICVSIDRFAAIHSLLGCALAEAAMQRLATTIIRTLRAADVVAQIGDGQLIVALAAGTQALAAAETVRQAIGSMGSASAALPVLTASIGVVSYPHDASDAAGLIAAATHAVTLKSNLGPDPAGAVAGKPPRDPPSRILRAYGREV
jgi:diguanylate cyclase (GGDEF)-like protein